MAKAVLFISHSSRDNDLVRNLLDLMESSFVVPPGTVRCTSVEDYMLDPGAMTAEALHKEISGAKIVIGVLTPNSLKAAWPLFELGAAWGLSRNPIPLLASPLSYSDLPGPLRGANALCIGDTDDMNRLLDHVRDTLCWTPRAANRRNDALAKFMNAIPASRSFVEPERWITRAELTDAQHGLRWSDLTGTCKNELYVWGWSCGNVVTPGTRGIFQDLATKGVKLRFLVFGPLEASEPSNINFGPVCNDDQKDISFDCKAARANIAWVREGLSRKAAANVSLRATNWVMTWSGVAVDPSTEHGLMQIEMYHYQNPYGARDHLSKRLELILSAKSEFYQGFWGSLEAMWDNATPLNTEN